MRIAWIGGLSRSAGDLERMAELRGHRLEFHSGDTRGRGADDLRAAVERADIVVIVTDVNSHGGVLLAKRTCQRLGRGALVLKRCGTSRLARLLDALDVQDGRLRAAS